MRLITVMIIFLGVGLLRVHYVEASDSIQGTSPVDILTGTRFTTNPGPNNVSWDIDMSLTARYHYSGMVGEPRHEFSTKMILHSLTASEKLTYTDPDTGASASAGPEFLAHQQLIDELGARKAFDSIKLIKAFFTAYLSNSLRHHFYDQEVHAPSERWGFSSPSILSWNAFYLNPFLPRTETPVDKLQMSYNYSDAEIKSIKEAYKDALRGAGYVNFSVIKHEEYYPEFAGIAEFEQAILDGLRKKVKGKEPAKPSKVESGRRPDRTYQRILPNGRIVTEQGVGSNAQQSQGNGVDFLYGSPGVDKNFNSAYNSLLPRANAGDSEAQFYLGVLYGNGLGVRRDRMTAFKWLRKASASGNAKAKYNLTAYYGNGSGPNASYSKGKYGAESAAEFGGRVGKIVLFNNLNQQVHVRLWHPDTGDVFNVETLGRGEKTNFGITGEVGVGDDWGVQVGNNRVKSILEVSKWQNGVFYISASDL